MGKDIGNQAQSYIFGGREKCGGAPLEDNLTISVKILNSHVVKKEFYF